MSRMGKTRQNASPLNENTAYPYGFDHGVMGKCPSELIEKKTTDIFMVVDFTWFRLHASVPKERVGEDAKKETAQGWKRRERGDGRDVGEGGRGEVRVTPTNDVTNMPLLNFKSCSLLKECWPLKMFPKRSHWRNVKHLLALSLRSHIECSRLLKQSTPPTSITLTHLHKSKSICLELQKFITAALF